MSTLDDFMTFNFCEDEREQQEAHQTTEYPYQSPFWEEKEDPSASSGTNYWDEDSSSEDDDF